MENTSKHNSATNYAVVVCHDCPICERKNCPDLMRPAKRKRRYSWKEIWARHDAVFAKERAEEDRIRSRLHRYDDALDRMKNHDEFRP